MVNLPVYDKSGKRIGDYPIDPTQIAEKINKQLLHDVALMYQASARQGTHQTKSRADVAGSTKKMYRQKGTGHARAGGKRSPIRVGGGHAFALRPRDYSYRLPKKAIRLATRMAIAGKIEKQRVAVVESLDLTAPKTREIAALLKALGFAGKSTLITTENHNPNVYRSARNIERVTISPVSDLNALAVLKPRHVVFTRAALDLVQQQAREGT